MQKSLIVLSLGLGLIISPAAFAQADVGSYSLDATRALKTVETNARMDVEQPKKVIHKKEEDDEPSITVEDGGVNRVNPANPSGK